MKKENRIKAFICLLSEKIQKKQGLYLLVAGDLISTWIGLTFFPALIYETNTGHLALGAFYPVAYFSVAWILSRVRKENLITQTCYLATSAILFVVVASNFTLALSALIYSILF